MKPAIFLVDAHAFLHRAYHALPPLTNPRGEPVGALFGFARMLIKLIKEEKPGGVAVCFDTPEKTFRHAAAADYKATRKELDPDLVFQLSKAREMVEAMGLRCVEAPGFEADDVMATLAKRCAKAGREAVLVTGDKDALQLVGGRIRVFNAAKNAWLGPSEVEEKLGVPPEAVIDYLTIIGDASDNVAGVKGVGPVGAVKLLKKFKTLDAALKAAKAGDPEIPPKTAAALVAGEQTARASGALITLREDAPVLDGPDDLSLPGADEDKLREVFGRLGLPSLIKEVLPGTASPEAPEPPIKSSAPIDAQGGGAVAVAERVSAPAAIEVSFKDLKKDLSRAAAITVAALRNSSRDLIDTSKAFLAVGSEDGRVAVFDEAALAADKTAVAALLRGGGKKCVYDLKDVLGSLETLGLELAGPYFDAKLAAYCLDPVRPKAEPPADGDWKGALLARAGRALGRTELERRMKAEGVLKLYEDVELPLAPVLRAMERAGIALDEPYLRRLSGEFEADIAALKAALDKMAGAPINVNSPKQLGELLFDKLALPVVHKTAKGGRSTDEEVLRALAEKHPLPAKVLEYRELTKLKSTYIDGLLQRLDPATGRVHTRFEQAGAETGRLSSVNPNLQNIPVRSASGQKIRRAFIARPGWVLVSADYSQIDLRVLAHVSGDAALAKAFAEGGDIHTRTASEAFGVPPEEVDKEMRRRAKAVNFGIVYGQTAFGLSHELGIPQKEAAAVITAYFTRYRGVADWVEKNLEEARRAGGVRTFLGRWRRLPELAAKNTALRQFGERAARNTPIQGGSADIIKLAMLKVHDGLASGKHGKAVMLLQIHDELLFEVPKAEAPAFAAWARREMEGAAQLDVPLVVDVKAGRDWQDMEPIK